MPTDTRREELCRILGQLYDDSLTRKFWRAAGRMFTWLPGARELELPLPVSSLLLILLTMLACALLALLAGAEEFYAGANLTYIWSVSAWVWLTINLGEWQTLKSLSFLQRHAPGLLDFPAGEEVMLNWVRLVSSRRNQAITAALFWLLMCASIGGGMKLDLTGLAGWTLFLPLILNQALCILHIYWVGALIVFYAVYFRRMTLRLFPDNPAGTVSLLALHKSAGWLLLVSALIAALMIPVGFLSGMLNATILIMSIVMLWAPLLAFFVSMESGFARHIRSAKSRRLRELQGQIALIEKRARIPDLPKADLIRKMLQIHAEVKNTPNTLVNVQSLANLFGSLALPLLSSAGKIIEIAKQYIHLP